MRAPRSDASPARRWTVLALTAGLLLPGPLHAEKTDVVILNNGDRITGEVKGLSRGKLDYSTDDAGRLAIEWVKIRRVTSPGLHEVELASGGKYFGRLAASSSDGEIVVQSAGADTLRIPSIVRISPLNTEFLQRVMAYLDVGFSLAKANRATTFNLTGQTQYRGPKYGFSLYLDSYAQGQESDPKTSRNTGEIQGIRYLPDRWSAVALAMAEQNDELNLAFRLTAGGAGRRVFSQSNNGEFGAAAGLVVAWERFHPEPSAAADADEGKTGLEGLLSASWEAFRFDSPSLDFSTSLALFPSLSETGRLRGELSVRLKYEVFSDFNVGIKITDTFDSRPPDETASTNDYITGLTIGWSYRR